MSTGNAALKNAENCLAIFKFSDGNYADRIMMEFLLIN